jgi:restriction endonuclease Mrr
MGEQRQLQICYFLIDGDLLARLMIHHSVGVRIVETMHYKKVDDDYFPEE